MTIEDEVRAAAPNLMREAAAFAGWSWRAKLEMIGALLVLVAAVLTWALWPAKPVHEDVTPAPQVIQADHSVIAARAPDAHPPAPRHIIPKGYTEERREAIVVTPAPTASSVEVDLSLVRNGTERRVIASSPDGQVVSAIDIPIEPALIPPAPKPWAAGLAYGTDRAVGVWLERDVGRMRLGVEVAKGAGHPRAELRVGVRF